MSTSIDVAAIADVPLTPNYWWPYAVALIAMVVFGFLGFRAGHHWLLWGIGGVTAALMTATSASGLANAIAVPYTDTVRNRNQLIAFIVVAAIFVPLGLLLAWRSRNSAAHEAADVRQTEVGRK